MGGFPMTNTLSALRSEVRDVLKAASYDAVEYVVENIDPPICVVIPADSYITTPSGNAYGAPYTIGIHVLIIAGHGTNEDSAYEIDSMIVGVVDALDEHWDITEVTAPQEMALKGTPYMGAVVTLEINTKIQKEVIING